MTDAAAGWTFADSNEMEWQSLGPDLEMKMLGAATGQAIGLFRFAPGYVGAAHVHEKPEFSYVLEGELKTTGATLGPGATYSAESGTTHDNFTDTGCTIVSVFAIPSDAEVGVLRLGSVIVGADDVDRAVAFWSAALGYETVHFPDAENGFTILRPPSGDGTRVAIQRSDTPADDHPRLHLDLIVDTADQQAVEAERLIGLGATRLEWDSSPDDPDFVVLADTEGNRFCIVDAGHG